MAHNTISIEVVYALAEQQVIKKIDLNDGFTVIDAVNLSGLLEEFPEISRETLKVGVFGKVCALDKALSANDRVEIYRSLINDPKVARRKRAKK